MVYDSFFAVGSVKFFCVNDQVEVLFWLASVLWEASFPQHRKAIQRLSPAMHRLPFRRQVFQRQVHHFQRRVLARKCPPRLDRPPQAHIQALNGIGRIDDLAQPPAETERKV